MCTVSTCLFQLIEAVVLPITIHKERFEACRCEDAVCTVSMCLFQLIEAVVLLMTHKERFEACCCEDAVCTVSMCLFQLIEAVVLPMTHKERFEALGIQPPKGVVFFLFFFLSAKHMIVGLYFK